MNQLSIYGAVDQDRSGEPDVLMGQSIVLGEIKTEIPLQNENLYIIEFYGNSTKNESNHFHQTAK